MPIPEVKVVVRTTAEESLYRPKGAKKQLDWEQFQAWLITEQGVKVSEAELCARAYYDNMLEFQQGRPTEFRLPTLTDSTKLLFSHFRWHSDRDGTVAQYVKVDTQTEQYCLTQDPMLTASAIEMDDGRTLEDLMTDMYVKLANQGLLSYISDKKTNEKGEEIAASSTLPTLAEYWEGMVKKVWARDSWFRLSHKPIEISEHPEIPCFFYWDRSRVKPGPHPAWDRWLETMPAYCRPAFRAWIYSVLDPENKGRQALWLQDQGYSGKSSVTRAFTRFLGNHAVGAISHGSLANQFGYSSIYGRRLVIYGDNKNPKLLHQEKVHSLLGGDIVSIERKMVQPFSAPIHAKLWVSSNIPPEIDLSARSEVTRILYIPMQEPPEHILKAYCKCDPSGKVVRHRDGTPVFVGGNLEDQLFPEIPAFLYTCSKDYAELCPNRTDIILSEEMYEILQTRCPSPEHTQLERFCAQTLEFDASYATAPHDIQDVFNGFIRGKGSNFDYSRLKSYLETTHQVISSKRKIDGVQKRLMIGVRLKEASSGGGLRL